MSAKSSLMETAQTPEHEQYYNQLQEIAHDLASDFMKAMESDQEKIGNFACAAKWLTGESSANDLELDADTLQILATALSNRALEILESEK